MIDPDTPRQFDNLPREFFIEEPVEAGGQGRIKLCTIKPADVDLQVSGFRVSFEAEGMSGARGVVPRHGMPLVGFGDLNPLDTLGTVQGGGGVALYFSPEGLDIIGPVEAEGRQDDPELLTMRAIFALQPEGGAHAGMVSRHQVTFAISRSVLRDEQIKLSFEPQVGDHLDETYRSLKEDWGVDRLILQSYPRNAGAPIDLGSVSVLGEQLSALSKATDVEMVATLDRIGDPQRAMTDALSLEEASGGDRLLQILDENGQHNPRLRLIPAPGRTLLAERSIRLLTGEALLREADHRRGFNLRLELLVQDGGKRRRLGAPISIPCAIEPVLGATRLIIEPLGVPGASMNRVDLPDELRPGAMVHKPLSGATLEDMGKDRGGVPVRSQVLELDFLLDGKLEANDEIRVDAQVEVISTKGQPVPPQGTPLVTIEHDQSANPRSPVSTSLIFRPGQRHARLWVRAPQSIAPYAKGYDGRIDPAAGCDIRVTIQARKPVEGVAVFERKFRITERRERRSLAIDLGTSCLAATLTDARGAPHLARLGSVLAQFDPAACEAGEYFISSMVSFDPQDNWRAEDVPQSLWAHVPDAAMAVDPRQAARGMNRHYALAVPPLGRGNPAAVVSGLKMQLGHRASSLELGTDVWSVESDPGVTRRINVEQAVSDLLHEIADFYLPWSGDMADAAYPRLVLTHPVRFGAEQKASLRRAAGALCTRLGLDANNAADLTLVAESDAVATYYLNRLPDGDKQQVRAVVFDLGGGTLDLSLVEADRTAPGLGGRVGKARSIARSGAELGGESIDLVLYFIIDAALAALDENARAQYQYALTEKAQGERHLTAKRHLARAIAAAKIDLTRRCRAASQNKRYHWPEDEIFRVQVGALGGQAAKWPVCEREGGAMRKGDVRLGKGLRLVRDGEAIWLEMSKAAVNRPAMQDLMHFLCHDALHYLFDRGAGQARHQEADFLIVSGRASLWPLVYENLSKTLAAGGIALDFASDQPGSETELKGAVTLGAISRAGDTAAGWDEQALAPAHYALLVSEIDFDGRERFQQLVPEAQFPALHSYGGYMRLVEVPPALTIRDLQENEWARAMVAPTGIAADPRDLNLAGHETAPELVRHADGRVELRIGRSTFQVDGSRFGHPAALHRAQFDVTQEHAPPKLPGSVAPDRLEAQAREDRTRSERSHVA
ncbi:MAG: hypothetical protein MRY63_13525 [Neomegalonema sp.]|nr:hypothetical protein [Neomegalonema sp.]